MKKDMRIIWVLYALLIAALGIGGVLAYQQYASPTPTPQPSSTPTPTPAVVITSLASPTPTASPQATPTPKPVTQAQVNLAVPFTVQAPYGNWDAVHEETCEEASILMASWYALGKTGSATNGYKNQIAPATAEAELQAMIAWEESMFGSAQDTNAEQTARIAREKLGLTNVTVKSTVTAQAIKEELSQGNVVVIPAAGQLLGNPYFTPPGPEYHMLLIRGYTSQGFIANDPGTRRGEEFVYPEAKLIAAVHDWTGSKATITQGAKRMIVIGKQN